MLAGFMNWSSCFGVVLCFLEAALLSYRIQDCLFVVVVVCVYVCVMFIVATSSSRKVLFAFLLFLTFTVAASYESPTAN